MGLFGNRDYRRLFAAQVVALFGTGLATIALGLLAYELAGERAGAVLGTALTIKMAAYVLLAPIAAAYAHWLPRRAFLVSLDLVRVGVVLALPFVTEIWQVYVLVFLLQAASAGFTPTFQASLPDVLPDERDYTRALSASQLASSMETLLSPMIAAVLLTVIDFHWLFAGTSAGFLTSAVLLLLTRIPRARAAATGGIWQRATAGTRIFLTTPRLRGVLALNFAVAGAGAIVMVNTVNYVYDELGLRDTAVAILLAANGAGTIVVALALPRVLDRVPERRVMTIGAAVLSAAAAAGVLLSTVDAGLPAALLVWGALGAGVAMVLTPNGRVLRRSSVPADRPAVFAAQFSLSHACWLLTYPIAGWLVTAAGFTAGWLVLTALTLLGTVGALLLWPRESELAGLAGVAG